MRQTSKLGQNIPQLLFLYTLSSSASRRTFSDDLTRVETDDTDIIATDRYMSDDLILYPLSRCLRLGLVSL